MKRGTKIGWLLIAVSIMLSVWVIISTSTVAEKNVGGYTLSDDETTLIAVDGSLSSIDIPATVTTINNDVFKNNAVITSVNIPDSVTNLGNGFQSCTGLQTVTIGTNITSIPSDTFNNCTSLTTVNFPAGLTTIEANAFRDCTGLKTITIPAGCTSVDPDTFNGCINMVGFNGGSSAYSVSADNCLYSVDGSTLVNVPDGKTNITIPANCTTIAAGAFNGSAVSSVTIPATVTSIGAQTNWAVAEIWGEQGSAADEYADAENIVFRQIGSSGGGGGSSTEYDIIQGADQTYTKGSGATLTITGDGDYADFSAVQVDGTNIDAANYSVAEGSTVVTLSNAYLESLGNGSHTFTIVWVDGTASTTLTVKAADGSTDPGNSTGYTITPGAGGTWTKGSGGTYSFTGSGPLSEFAGIKVDGTTVGASNYSATTSPTIITLSNAYLESLSVGTHSVTVVWTGGTATANFTVAAAGTTGKDSTGTTSKTTTTTTTKTSTGTGTSHTKDYTPKTADFSIDPRYFLALGVMLAGIAIVINGREKQINYVNKRRNE
ncbi:MAG: leucine-rich repeat domain-containing protein [Lachnospiraceae bacterium]|nr:leucine-rich repeat domain-containing protein [Lachnospiraceae bacterium]